LINRQQFFGRIVGGIDQRETVRTISSRHSFNSAQASAKYIYHRHLPFEPFARTFVHSQFLLLKTLISGDGIFKQREKQKPEKWEII
jgi:hypothetical protein